MKKIFKILLPVALCLILLGGIAFTIGFGCSGCKWGELGNTKVEQKLFTEREDNLLSSIEINYENADIQITFDETATAVTIEYPQLQNKKGKNLSEVTVTEGENSVVIREKIADWTFGSWDFSSPAMNVVLPAARSFALTIDTDNGDIKVTGTGKLSTAKLTTDNGDVNARRATVVCEKALTLTSNNGDVLLFKDFQAASLYAETDNGDVCAYSGTVSGKIELETDNGDIEASEGVLKAAEMRMETDNGDIELKKLDADKITLLTDTGDIEATLVGKKTDYSITAKTDLGDKNITNSSGGAKSLRAESDLGDIDIYFTEK